MRIIDTKDYNPWPPQSPATVRTDGDDMVDMVHDGARVALVHGHEYILTYFQRRIEPHGVVEIKTTRNGVEVWVGGECRYVGTGKAAP